MKGIVHVTWSRDGVEDRAAFPMTESYQKEGLYLTPGFQDTGEGKVFSLNWKSEIPLVLKELFIEVGPDVTPEAKMMINGYQTWTQSREVGIRDKISPLRLLGRKILAPYGDYGFHKPLYKESFLHSWTYTYFRRPGKSLLFYGSLNEDFAFTVFEYAFQPNRLMIRKDIEDLSMPKEAEVFKLYIGEGNELQLWNEYTQLIPISRPPVEKCTGWTSWYYYYTGITEKILLENLTALKEKGLGMDVFQIDDGWQSAIGDWLTVNEKFPSGMKSLAEKIHQAGYRPGLWLAPFVCVPKSRMYVEHPEWLLRDQKGKPVKAGWNPGWGGWFYALDFYAPGFQDHLRQVFQTVLDEWGYGMVKLDFLYAAALRHQKTRSRGQIMAEVMAFINQVVGENWVLGCGVPLGSSFGQVDYCRIGGDVAPYWEDKKLVLLNYRERVSTYNSLLSTLGRWQLNGRVFLNDPDVFLLRDPENKLTDPERFTLFLLNHLLGGLVFFSDNITEYTDQQMNWLESAYPTVTPEILEVVEENMVYLIRFQINKRLYKVVTNLSENRYSFALDQPAFAEETDYLEKGESITLAPHETICLHPIIESTKEPFLLGSKGHLFPGAQISTFDVSGENVEIELFEGSSGNTKIYLGVPNQFTNVRINGKYHSVKLTSQGLRYVSVSMENL